MYAFAQNDFLNNILHNLSMADKVALNWSSCDISEFLYPASCSNILLFFRGLLFASLLSICKATAISCAQVAALLLRLCNWPNGVMVRASASQSVDLGFISLVELCQKTLKNDIHSFSAWRLTQKGWCGKQAGKLACCVLGQDTLRDASVFMWQPGSGVKQSTLRGGPVYLKTSEKG